MNQILSIQSEGNNFNNVSNVRNVEPRKPSNKAELSTIIKVFCTLIILFGLVLVGSSVYAIISSRPKLKDNPIITMRREGLEATIRVTSERPIRQISYKWGQGDSKIIPGNNTSEIETVVEIPEGNNLLNITIIDYYGNKTEYQKQYVDNRVDKVKPTIEITVSGNTLNIIASDETEMSYLTYAWNDEEVTRVDVERNAEDKTILQASVEVRKGQNTLNIVAVDKDGNKETKTQAIKGANKPTFTVETEGNNLVVNAKDDEGISKIAITVDGMTTDTGDTPINQKEITAKQEITPGTHTITITITNMSGLKEEQSFTAQL